MRLCDDAARDPNVSKSNNVSLVLLLAVKCSQPGL